MKRSDIALYEAKRVGSRPLRGFRCRDAVAPGRRRVRSRSKSSARCATINSRPGFNRSRHGDRRDPRLRGARRAGAIPCAASLSPDNFIPVAEQSGAIVEIGQAILEKACRAAADWDPRADGRGQLLARRISPSRGARRSVKQTLLRTRLDPSRLYVEITESLMLEDSDETRAAVKQLPDYRRALLARRFRRRLFLAVLHPGLPVLEDQDRPQIHRAHRQRPGLGGDHRLRRVLAERTQMEIVAEGVETRGQEMALRQLGIKHAQGLPVWTSAARQLRDASPTSPPAISAFAARGYQPLSGGGRAGDGSRRGARKNSAARTPPLRRFASGPPRA